MKQMSRVAIASLGLFVLSAWGYVPEPQPVKSDVEITAIYYPGTDQMSEWDVIAQTCPERRPLLGWFDEGNPEAIDWQIKWAVEHGITSFCVDWYWNKGFRRLEHWVKGYYKAKYRRHLKWFMMYANHNQPGAHSTEDQIAVTKYWIDNYFKTPEYYTIDGKPAVCYWDAGNLDRDFIAEAAKKGEKLAPGEGIKRAFAISERMVREAGLPGIYWIDMWRTKQFDPDYAKQRVEQGYRAAIHYGFEHYAPTLSPEAMKPGDTPNRFDYDAVVATAPKIWNELSVQDTLPFWVIIPTGWDDRPRSFSDSRVITGRTPEKFAEICRQAKAFCDRHGRRHAIIMPMNEWQEGSYIEPNGEYGFGMYDAIREAFCTKPKDGWPKNLKPEDVGLGPYDYPPLYRSQAPSWEFDDGTTGGWYRQPYGGGELESKDGCLHFWINWWKRNYNIRQRMVPFAAKNYAKFRVRMRVTPNAATGMNGVTAPDLRIKWGTAETPIIGKGLIVDEVRNVASCPVKVDGEFHEYEIDLKSNPDWKGEIDELWFEACQVIHARAAIDWMRFVTVEEDAVISGLSARYRAPALLATPGQYEAARKRIVEDADAARWWKKFRGDIDARLAAGVSVPTGVVEWAHHYVCRKCATRLETESPVRHVCPKCGELHTGWPYDGAARYGEHMATAEFVRDLGVAWNLCGDGRYLAAAAEVLVRYAELYPGFPLHDNFRNENPQGFRAKLYSQELDEAIWLIKLLQGYDAFGEALDENVKRKFIDDVVRPAINVIDRDLCGIHNISCWQRGAVVLAALTLGDEAMLGRAIYGENGLKDQIAKGIREDGLWYENAWGYHFYTADALSHSIRALENLGEEVDSRCRKMWSAPALAVMPTGYLPAINDTAAVPFSSESDRATMEYALYGSVPGGGDPEAAKRSALLAPSGIAILRSRSAVADGTAPDNYVALAAGPKSGMHDHPDRLSFILCGRGELISEDPGCISYGSLRQGNWYRSTLSHDTLRIDGADQTCVDAKIADFGTTSNGAWAVAVADGIAPGVKAERRLTLDGDVLTDELRVTSETEHVYELAFHAIGDFSSSRDAAMKPVENLPPPPKTWDEAFWEDHGRSSWCWTQDACEAPHDGRYTARWTTPAGTTLDLEVTSPTGYLRVAVGPGQPGNVGISGGASEAKNAAAKTGDRYFTMAVNRIKATNAVFTAVYRLSSVALPAYDMAFAYNPNGAWTSRHQMTFNGKRWDFAEEDFVAVGRSACLTRLKMRRAFEQIRSAVARWPEFAAAARVEESVAERIGVMLKSRW